MTSDNEQRQLRSEIESLRAQLKASQREVKRLTGQLADAERRVTFTQEVLTEERRQADRERADSEKRIELFMHPQDAPYLVAPEPEPPPVPVEPAPPVEAHEEPPPAVAPEPADAGRGPLGRLMGRRRASEETLRKCNVCDRALDEDEMRAGGWLISGPVAVCRQCKADGWELEKEALLPFRRPQRDSKAQAG